MQKEKVLVILVSVIFVFGCLLLVDAKTSVVNLRDWQKVQIVSPLESNGAIPINVQDQYTPAFDVYFVQFIANVTLQADTIIDTYTINLTTGHGANIGDQIDMVDSAKNRGFLGLVVANGTNIITLDRPMTNNLSYLTTTAGRYTRDLNVDGSVTPQTFVISPPLDVQIDITRVMFQMITDTEPDFGKFGDLAVLTNGLVMRTVNGGISNLFNVKSNAELVNLMYDVTFYDTSHPGQGVYGLGGRLTYGGQNKHGVTIRLGQNQSLQVIVQDNLEDLADFHMIAAGHVVTD